MDPNYHIRLRLHCTNINNYAFILHLIQENSLTVMLRI